MERFESEIWWSQRYEWLQSIGYTLRPRYHPDWKPSFRESDWHPDFEDGNRSPCSYIVDAIRERDGAHVVIKQVYPPDNPLEEDMARLLGTGELAKDPTNHCIPTYDLLHIPDDAEFILIVIPIARKYDDPRFDTVGEVLECFRQVFEGVYFMHRHHIAHRDCGFKNIMLDPCDMYPEGFHYVRPSRAPNWKSRARYYTRTQRPPRYWLIDFGLTTQHDPADPAPRDRIIRGVDRSVPEHTVENIKANVQVNPFPVDVYFMGNWVREHFIEAYHGFEFLTPFIQPMVDRDPLKRPTMVEVVERYDKILASVPNSVLRARAVRKSEHPIMAVLRTIGYWKRRIVYQVKGVPALPRRSASPSKAPGSSANEVTDDAPPSSAQPVHPERAPPPLSRTHSVPENTSLPGPPPASPKCSIHPENISLPASPTLPLSA